MKIICSLLLVCLTALPSLAFMPDGGELAASLRKNYGPMRSWQAEMTFPEHPGVSVALWYSMGRWRQEWRAGDKAVAVGSLGNAAGACTAGAFPLSPLFVWMVPDPLESWKAWGVDETVGNFGFCGEQPCLMLGADPMDQSAPAVHLNNENYAPLLVRYGSDLGPVTVEFLDYKTYAGYRVPQKVLLKVGERELECAVEWRRVNGADNEELYAVDALDPTPCAEPPQPFGFLRESFRYPGAR